MSSRHGSDLHPQAFRLSRRARDRLSALATELLAAGFDVTAAEAARGLCLLALDLALGFAGADTAAAFRLAASDPTEVGIGKALDAFLNLLEVDSAERRSLRDARSLEQTHTSGRARRALHTQALRLPQVVRDQFNALALELSADGADVTVGEATRGLFLLALDLAFGFAGTEATYAFRLAARDPTVEGASRALTEVRFLLDPVPSTTPDPAASEEGAITTRGVDSSPPSTFRTDRAA